MEKENKIVLFEEKNIRKIWHNEEWFFSVIDVIEAITNSATPRKYWSTLKAREPQLSSVCGQLKMIAVDGRERLTDATNTEGMLRVIMSVPSPKAELFKIWLAQLNEEQIDKIDKIDNNYYKALLLQIVNHIEEAKTKAVVSVNQQLIHLYWRVGNLILKLQDQSDWGSKITLQLSKDLKRSFPSMTGLSDRNLKYMRKFAKENPDFKFVQESLAQIE